jgi:RNA polymerase sigma-70 factor (ECF subfamily)
MYGAVRVSYGCCGWPRTSARRRLPRMAIEILVARRQQPAAADTIVSAPPCAQSASASFEIVVLPHLDAGRRLARWLMRDDDDTDDVVQEASLRALRYFRTFNGGDGRAWFLRIVRNTCYAWRRSGTAALTDPFDEEQHSIRPQSDPEAQLLRRDGATAIGRAMRSLPDQFHDLLVLREVEGLSYRELSEHIGIPVGTVMSRLSRARGALRGVLEDETRARGAA